MCPLLASQLEGITTGLYSIYSISITHKIFTIGCELSYLDSKFYAFENVKQKHLLIQACHAISETWVKNIQTAAECLMNIQYQYSSEENFCVFPLILSFFVKTITLKCCICVICK